MDINKFLNNNVGSYRADTINKIIIKYDITRDKAENIYNNWRKKYLMDYTPVTQLNNNIFYYRNKYRRWTYEERVNVVRLKENGFKIKCIAEIYNVSRKSILNVLDNMSN